MAPGTCELVRLQLLGVLLLTPVEAEQPAQCSLALFFSSRRTARFFIGLSLATVLLLMLVMGAYSKLTERRYVRTGKKMMRASLGELLLAEILRNFSLASVHDFHFHGIKPKVEKVTIAFKELRTTIKEKKGILNGFVHEPEKVLLSGVTGEFQPGRMAAIMGPSGAGKTTLLNVLCGKTTSGGGWQVDGEVSINGKPGHMDDFRPVVGFVPQDDIVHEGMTVRENVRFSAQLRNAKGTSKKSLTKITEDVLKVLQLEPQQNIVVGNRLFGRGGLSGGQRKRVNIGLELAACPTVLFLDEPTSGLDSTTSLLLCEMLKKMTDLGMTIVMVIHQPRYGLFTLIDDVLLLGKGGRTAYVGPTVGAKLYLESLGFAMPPNENPADWMMDILSGQNVVIENPNIPTRNLPLALFKAWETRDPSYDGVSFRRQTTMRDMEAVRQDDQDIIRKHVKDEWDKFTPEGGPLDLDAFTQFLQSCLGESIQDHPDCQDVVGGLLEEAAGPDSEEITQQQFVEHLLKFRRANMAGAEEEDEGRYILDASGDSSEGSSSSDDEAPFQASARGDLHRVQPGFFVHMRIVMERNLLQWWRNLWMRLAFIGLVVFSACFLGFFDAVIFQNPPWMPTVLLNAHVSVALLVSVYCLGLFSRDQPMYWREASHGLNRFAFMTGRMIVDTIDVLLLCCFFTVTYYVIVYPRLSFEIYVWPFFLVSLVASGWGYLISTCVPGVLAPFTTAVICFMLGGILGLPDKMHIFLNGGWLEVIVGVLCFTRWSAPMDFLAYDWCGNINVTNSDKFIQAQYDLYKSGYEGGHFLLSVGPTTQWYTGMVALLLMAFALRLFTYPALRFIHASKQR